MQCIGLHSKDSIWIVAAGRRIHVQVVGNRQNDNKKCHCPSSISNAQCFDQETVELIGVVETTLIEICVIENEAALFV